MVSWTCRGSDGRAVMPDRRNDENLILVQLHKAVAQFHNKIVDYARAQGIRQEWLFETARRLTRWHYQWAVIHDFLPRFVGDELVGPTGTVYKEVAGKPPVINLNYYKPTNRQGRPFMPVEFAVAAYRFGHSLIRPFYVLNSSGIVDVFGPEGAATSTVAARSHPTWSSSGRTSFPSTRPSRPARRARSTPSCRFPSAPSPGRPSHLLTRRGTWLSATHCAESTSACRRGSRSRGRCGSTCCPTRRSASIAIRDGAARRHCGSTSSRRPSCRRTRGSGSGRRVAGSWPRPWSGFCSGIPTPTYTWTRPGTRPTDRADDRQVRIRRPTEIRRCCLIAGAHRRQSSSS